MSHKLPTRLAEIVEDFSSISDRHERIEMLMHYADQFSEVPPEVATRPFSGNNHVTACESDAYVWALPQPDNSLKLHFAVENPQGLSAMALSAILEQTISGLPAEELADLPCDIVYTLFGQEISMGKGQGLMGIINMVKAFAKQEVRRASAGL